MTNVATVKDIDLTPATAAQPVSASASIVQMIERVALNPSIDIDRMDKLLTFLERIKATEAEAAFTSDFAAMQGDLPSIDANGRIVHGTGTNEKVIAKYAKWEDINDAIKPVLAKHRFVLVFESEQPDGRIVITAILKHVGGHKERATLSFPLDTSGGKSNVHAIASSVSYAKRHAASLVLNLSSRAKEDSDDDGKAAGAGQLTDDQIAALRSKIMEANADLPKFLDKFQIEIIDDLPPGQFKRAMALLDAKIARGAAA
jgi:hypothetical protein